MAQSDDRISNVASDNLRARTQHRNEDCPFLSLAMPCIAVKEDLIGELISVPLAWNTLEIFLKCVNYLLTPLLMTGHMIDEDMFLHNVAFLQPTSSVGQPGEQSGGGINSSLSSETPNKKTDKVGTGPNDAAATSLEPGKRMQQMLRNFLVGSNTLAGCRLLNEARGCSIQI